MPSVGMRRTTRVFGARVLRSGRRLRTGPFEEVKHMRATVNGGGGGGGGNDWLHLIEVDNDGDGDGNDGDNSRVAEFRAQGRCKNSCWRHEDEMEDIDDEHRQQTQQLPVNSRKIGLVDDGITQDRRWGKVYTRKRTRVLAGSYDSDENKRSDRRFGKKFVRKQARKKIKRGMMVNFDSSKSESLGGEVSMRITVLVESSCSCSSWLPCFLTSVFRYMMKKTAKLLQLFYFLSSEPLSAVFRSHGIRFLQDSNSIKSSGFCNIFDSVDSIPLFSVDFSVIPLCFMRLHTSLLLKSDFLYYALLVMQRIGTELSDMESSDDDVEEPSCSHCERDQTLSELFTIVHANSKKNKVGKVSVPKILRNGVSTRGIQKRRTSLRSRRHRNPSVTSMRKANGVLLSDLMSKQDGFPFFPRKPNPELACSVRKTSGANTKEIKSNLVELTQDIVSASCNANILVTESDRCYREGGAVVALESSDAQEWFLVVKRNGSKRFSLMAQKAMRPCSFNRITHAVIWTSDVGWKLEFPSRQDWLIFKELHQKCSELNVEASTVSVIPVPGVREIAGYTEVSGYAAEESVPFTRPDYYISSKGDEVTRALDNNNPLYDMDSDDEEWLKKFNHESCTENESDKWVSEDTFEKIIDAFERGIYCNPDGYSDVNIAVEHCLGLASRETLEALYTYWMTKRKKKRSALIPIFQCYQPRRSEQLTFKAVLRKKRSFKRHANQSQGGRGKQLTSLKAIRKEHSVEEVHNANLKVQESEAVARRLEQAAVAKRQRAQVLMDFADMATYKATLALGIAEATKQAEARSVDTNSATAHFFLAE